VGRCPGWAFYGKVTWGAEFGPQCRLHALNRRTRRKPYHVRQFGCSRRGFPGRNSRRLRDAGVRPVPTTSQPRRIGLKRRPLGSDAHVPANWALQILAQSPFWISLSPCPNRPDWVPKLNVREHKLLRRAHSRAILAVQKAKSAVSQACANHSWRRLINWEKTVQPGFTHHCGPHQSRLSRPVTVQMATTKCLLNSAVRVQFFPTCRSLHRRQEVPPRKPTRPSTISLPLPLPGRPNFASSNQ
jgi:ribosomal protein L37E